MDSDEIEYTLLQKPDMRVYEIPPSARATGHMAGEWTNCIAQGKVKVVARSDKLAIQLMDKQNQLFAVCPVDPKNVEQAVERTRDSSRYFVLRLIGPQGQHAFVGIGFDERNDAFDFWAALVDFSRQTESETASLGPGPDLSGLRLQEGQTFSLGGAQSAQPAPAQPAEKKALFKLRPPPG